jgi:hypothetical protein
MLFQLLFGIRVLLRPSGNGRPHVEFWQRFKKQNRSNAFLSLCGLEL